MSIIDIRHPDYSCNIDLWEKYRLTYNSECSFRDKYLEKLSAREDSTDFALRKAMTYIPAFAKAAVKEIENAVSQRIGSVVRKGGPFTYRESVKGNLGGVNRHDSKMNQFVVTEILPELTQIGKVGVYVDNAIFAGSSLYDVKNSHPYFYIYQAENILSWKFTESQEGSELVALLLRDVNPVIDDEFGLPSGSDVRYRYLSLELNPAGERFVNVMFFDSKGKQISTSILEIPKIPFVIFDIGDSLLKNTADMQIALMNLGSSDLSYLLKSNFPFYTEQQSSKLGQEHLLQQSSGGIDGTSIGSVGPTKPEIKVGNTDGRTYLQGLDRPGFIAPPVDPVKVSMDKQEQLKREIRILTFLSVAELNPVSASADSKKQNVLNMEAGLSFIGMSLELGERQLANIFSLYEDKVNPEYVTIFYPSQYSLQSESDRHAEAKNKRELIGTIPSLTFKKEVSKQIVKITIADKISNETLERIEKEIDSANYIIADPQFLIDVKNQGGITSETFSEVSGFSKEEGKDAFLQGVKKAELIMEAQTKGKGDLPNMGARGIPELDVNPDSSRDEKQIAKLKGKKLRGKGRNR